MTMKHIVYRIFYKVAKSILNFYNGIIFYLLLFCVKFLLNTNNIEMANKIWKYGFRFYCTNYFLFISRIVNGVIVVLTFFFYLLLILFFSFIIYNFFINLLLEYLLGLSLFACNKAFLFFLINLFFYFIFYDDKLLSFMNFDVLNVDELDLIDSNEEGEWRYLGMDLDLEADEEEEHFEIENIESDVDIAMELNDYDGYHLDFLSVDSLDDIIFGDNVDKYYDDSYYLELFENLSFFDKWLGLSNDIISKMYPTNVGNVSHDPKDFIKIVDCDFKNFFLETNNKFVDFVEIIDLKNLLSYHILLLDDYLLSDSIWFQLQLTDPRFVKKNKLFLSVSKKKPELLNLQGFKNKYSNRNIEKLSFLKVNKLTNSFYTRFNYDNKLRIHRRLKYRHFQGISSLQLLSRMNTQNSINLLNFFHINLQNINLDYTNYTLKGNPKLTFFNSLLLKINNSGGPVDVGSKETLLKKFKLRFYDFKILFLENDESTNSNLFINDLQTFFEQFFKLVLQENFDEEDLRFFNQTDIVSTLNLIEFFFSFLIICLPLVLQVVTLNMLHKFLLTNQFNLSLSKNLSNFLVLLEAQRKESNLILLMIYWKSVEEDFSVINSNLKFHKILLKLIKEDNFEYLFRDLYYSYNSFSDYSNDILIDHQKVIRREFKENFETESRFIELLNPIFRTYHLTNKYNERSLTWKFDGIYEFFVYAPFQYLNPFISQNKLKNFFFKLNSRELFFKKRKILDKYNNNYKEKFVNRLQKYLAFFFTKFLFFFFDKKYWILRFIPYVFNYCKFNAFGGTLVEFNQRIYSNVIRRLYNFGISEPKYKVDFLNIISQNYFENVSLDRNPLSIVNRTESYFPNVLNVSLNYEVLLKLNLFYNSSVEIEFIYFLLFLKRNIFFRKGLNSFFKLLNSNYWLLNKRRFESKLVLNSLFFDLCEDIFLNKLVIRSNSSYKYKLSIYKKVKNLSVVDNNFYSLRKKKLRSIIFNKKQFNSVFNINLKNYDVEILGLFLNKFWMNDYYDSYHSQINLDTDPLWGDGTGGGMILNEENFLDSLSPNVLWDNIWDWHVLNWEIILHLFNDLDNLYLNNEVEFFEKEDGHFFYLLLVVIWFWFYCRVFKFFNFNKSKLKKKFRKYTKTSTKSGSMGRFVFENFVQSTGRNRLLGQNYVGQNRSRFRPPVFLVSFHMLYDTPTILSLKDYKLALKNVKASQFTLRRFKNVKTYRNTLFKSKSLKSFQTGLDFFKLKNNMLSWLIYSGLKPVNLNINYVESSSKIVDLSLIRQFLHWSKYYDMQKFYKPGLRHQRPGELKLKTLGRLWDRFFFNIFGYYPDSSGGSEIFDKLVDLEYKNYIIRNARRRRMDNYNYEVRYGATEMTKSQKIFFDKLNFNSELHGIFETKGKSFVSELLFFNLLRESFRDKVNGRRFFKNSNASLFLNGFYGSMLKNNIQYRSQVRRTFKNTLNRLPKLVNFISNIKKERRDDFLYKSNLFNFLFKLLSQFADEDFLVFNDNKFKENNFDFENFTRFSSWYDTLYKNPYSFKKYTSLSRKRGYIFNFYPMILNQEIFDKIFLNYVDLAHAFEQFLKSTDFSFLANAKSIAKKNKIIEYSGNLSAERLLYFTNAMRNYFEFNDIDTNINLIANINVNRYLYLEFLKRFINQTQFNLFFDFINLIKNKKLYHLNFLRIYKKKSPKKNFFKKQDLYLPYYRYPFLKFSLLESMLNFSFHYRLGFSNQNILKKNFLFVGLDKSVTSTYRKFRKTTYKDYFMEGLFNLGRQYVDFYENDNGFNRQLDLKMGAYGGQYFGHFLNYGAHSRQYQWYLGSDDIFGESLRRVHHIPSWIWSYTLRRHLGYKRLKMRRYIVSTGMVPGYSSTNKIVSRGRTFYGSRFFKSMPVNFTFEDNQFPSEEGYVGFNLIPAFGKIFTVIVMPFNYIFHFLQRFEFLHDLDAPYDYYGDINKRPRWIFNFLSLKDFNSLQIRDNLYETHMGSIKPSYLKFRGMLPSDYFLNRDQNITLFKFIDNFFKDFFFTYNDKDLSYFYKNMKRRSSRKNVDLVELYMPLKLLLSSRTHFFSFFSLFFVLLIIYLSFYYLIWIPVHYLTFAINHTFDGAFSREDEYIMEDELMLLTRDLCKDFYILPSHFPLLKNNFDDFYNRSFYVNPEINIFDYLTLKSFNFLEYDFISSLYEAPQFDNFGTRDLLFYSSIISQFIRNEIIDIFLIRIFDYQSLSFNLFDVFSISSNLYYSDRMKAPHPQFRAVYSEFFNILIGRELNVTDFLEEYIYNLQSYNKNTFCSATKRSRSFFNHIKRQKYLGDGVYIRKKSKKKNKLKSFKSSIKKVKINDHFEYLHNLVFTDLADNPMNRSVRQTSWSSLVFLKDGLKILNIRDSILLNSDLLHMTLLSEQSDMSNLYFSEFLSFLPKGVWGFMQSGFLNQTFIQQYKAGEHFLPFYFRFNRVDNFTFSDIGDYNEIYSSRFFNLNSEFLATVSRSKLQGFNYFFDIKDVGFIHSINGENLSSEIALSLLHNFKIYLDQYLLQERYTYMDSAIFEEHIKEIYYYYSKEYLIYLLDNDFDADDWNLLIEENRDWLMVQPMFGELKVELTYEMNPLIFEFEYYKDSSVDLKARIVRTIPFFNYHGINYNLLRRYGYTYLSDSKFYGLYEKIPFVRSFVYDAIIEDRLDADIETRSLLDPDPSDTFSEELEFPDQYTFFSNFQTKYSTDFFLTNESLLFNSTYSSFYNSIDNSLFLHLYLLQFFSIQKLEDVNQRFESQGNKLDLKFEMLSSNQYILYSSFYGNIQSQRLLLLFEFNTKMYNSKNTKFLYTSKKFYWVLSQMLYCILFFSFLYFFFFFLIFLY